MMEKIFSVLKSDPKRSCLIPEELRQISPQEISSEEVIVGNNDVRYTGYPYQFFCTNNSVLITVVNLM
jgi:hypothetical protein